MAGQRPATPVPGEVAEHPTFDLVPFARPWLNVTRRDPVPRVIGEAPRLPFPQPASAAVRSGPTGSDQGPMRLGMCAPVHAVPPSAQGFRGKRGRNMVHAERLPGSFGPAAPDAARVIGAEGALVVRWNRFPVGMAEVGPAHEEAALAATRVRSERADEPGTARDRHMTACRSFMNGFPELRSGQPSARNAALKDRDTG